MERIIVLIDMDCFFCQVEAKIQPEYQGKPLAVVQYTPGRTGGIIAVNYEAREFGVTRFMRGNEAKEKCPDIIIATVPSLRDKPDTSRYRRAGQEVLDVIKTHCSVIERASVDEAYLDITDVVEKRMSSKIFSQSDFLERLQTTHIVGYSENGKNDQEEQEEGIRDWIENIFEDETSHIENVRLAIGGIIVEEIRADVCKKTGFKCSAGISQNKILAKLACGLHKPNRQTILPVAALADLYSKLPIKKVRNLGGKFGKILVESLGCNVMGDLLQYSLQYLQKRFDEKTGSWLYNIARGIDHEPVVTRLIAKSIGACKQFHGKQAIVDLEKLQHWCGKLAAEVAERLEEDLEENERRATLLTISFHYIQNDTASSQSRSYALNSYKPEKMANQCIDIVTKAITIGKTPMTQLSISASKFVASKGNQNLKNFFKITDTPIETKNEKNTSPMTQRVTKLVNICHKTSLNKTNSSTNDSEKSKVLSDNEIVDSNTFKDSFFMNILKNETNLCDDGMVRENLDQPSTSRQINEIEEESLIELKEIFPDLNNIDTSLIPLLPPKLQEEAKSHLRAQQQNNIETNKKSKGKSSKSKINATKIQKNHPFYNFFMKNTTSDSIGKQCPRCSQSIPENKYVEHSDFHLAQDLQQSINGKRKSDEGMGPIVQTVKRRLSNENALHLT